MFASDGKYFVPTAHAAGPWDPGMLHGGAVAALLARQIERVETLVGLGLARLTVDLFRPVPMRPLAVRTRVARNGKKIQLVEASISDGEVEVARATGLRLRTGSFALPPSARVAWEAPPGPDSGLEPETLISRPSGYFSGIETRVIEGDFRTPGPAAAWFRLLRPVVDGEEASPLVRLAAVADFGNGLSSVLDVESWRYLNADLTLYVHRLPQGEWILLRSRTSAESTGIGLSETLLADFLGPVARAHQSLLLEPRVVGGAAPD